MAIDTRPPSVESEPEVVRPISYKAPIIMGVLGLFALIVFGLRGTSGETTTFDLTLGSEAITSTAGLTRLRTCGLANSAV